jgi:hypothetical protein
MAQLTDIVCLLLLGEDDEVFLGSTFPISEPHRLYLGAAHSIPAGREDELQIMAFLDSGLKVIRVTAIEPLAGHRDVVVQAEEGLRPWKRLAAGEVFVWEQVSAVGYPEMDIRELESGQRTADVRGLVGTVSRKVESHQILKISASAYEVSFAFPNGMSGGASLFRECWCPDRPGRGLFGELVRILDPVLRGSRGQWGTAQDNTGITNH